MPRKATQVALHSHCQVSEFLPHSPCKQTQIQMGHNHGQSPLKALLHSDGKSHKTHNMTTRYGNQSLMYDDTKDTTAPHHMAPLENSAPIHSIQEQDGETNTEYSEEPNPHRDLAELWEHFQQLQE